MQVEALEISEVLLLTPKRFGDERGYFSEVYNKKALAQIGISQEFVQDNHAFSVEVGTLRGLHYQIEPYAQDKLVRVEQGAIFDVAVDIRVASPTFGKAVFVRLSAASGEQIFVPKGFAHGYVTLESDTHVEYKVSNYYSPQHERGIKWDDPELNIPWPFREEELQINERDQQFPCLKEVFQKASINE